MPRPTFTLLITTKNRREALAFTLQNIKPLLERDDVECILCDDGSTDGTFGFVRERFPKVSLVRNETSKGLIYSRNRLMGMVTSEYAISLDDDAHFSTEKPLEEIAKHFEANPNCGVLAFRIYWGVHGPLTTQSNQKPERVKGFVGCGHAWRMATWRDISNYPEWFVFYGEEDFAAHHLFMKAWEVHYLPSVLVHHRVEVKQRKQQKDYIIRTRRSLRSGWYLYFLFLPWRYVPRKLAYSLWAQLKLKVLKGDWKSGVGILQAMGDLMVNMPKLLKQRKALNLQQFGEFSKLRETKIYWSPEHER